MSKRLNGLGHCPLHGDYEWYAIILEHREVYSGKFDDYRKNVKDISKLNQEIYIIENCCPNPKCTHREFAEQNISN